MTKKRAVYEFENVGSICEIINIGSRDPVRAKLVRVEDVEETRPSLPTSTPPLP